jgi:hypothetical protein
MQETDRGGVRMKAWNCRRCSVGRVVFLLASLAIVALGVTPTPARADGVCGAWFPLGGVLASDPVVAANADGRLEVFARGTDGRVWHRAQTVRNTCDPNAWTGWSSTGGVLTSDPAAFLNRDGRLEVFFRGDDNAVWHQAQTTPGASAWSAPTSLGGFVTSDPAVASNVDGRLEVFVRGADNAVWHRAQTAPSASTWSNWLSLGGVVTSDPVAAANLDGRLQVFARGTDNAIWYRAQRAPNTTTDWSFTPGGGWTTLGGIVVNNEALNGALPRVVSVTPQADGRLDVFAVGTDRALWHRYQVAPNSTTWSFTPGGGWTPLGGVLTSSVVTGRNRGGTLDVLSRGTNNAVWHRFQTAANAADSWSGWLSLGGIITSDPAMGANADGRLEVFVRGLDNGLWHRAQP